MPPSFVGLRVRIMLQTPQPGPTQCEPRFGGAFLLAGR
jgi:hypothetical protein